jgi:hypothetical protein
VRTMIASWKTALWVAGPIVLSACGGGSRVDEGTAENGPVPSGERCGPVESTLPDDATLATGAGRYRITLVGSDGSATADGTLTLRERPAGMRMLDDSATPLGGTVEIDLAAVGAQVVRELDSDDPAAPGVLVLERDAVSGRSVLLRLGSEANRIDRQPFDAAFTVLDVRRIDGEGFFGDWRSGVRAERSEGYFCAWREGA